MANFWSNETQLNFHEAVANLQDLTKHPASEEYYRDRESPNAPGPHILKVRDELQLADDLAFLANCEEGVGSVSAVTIQERGNGITIVLTSNKTPEEPTIKGLSNILATVSKYSATVRDREKVCQKLLNQVIELCCPRILQRIKPSWASEPLCIGTKRSFLLSRLEEYREERGDQAKEVPALQILLKKLDALENSLRPLEYEMSLDGIIIHLTAVIRSAADVVQVGGKTSLEKYLRSLGIFQDSLASYDIAQIDKLARYYHICKDLLKIARHPTYRPLFHNITLEPLESYGELQRPGIAKLCYVHPEIQQVFHHARYSRGPLPRAIGCSKSACYLCDLFLKKQGLFRVSHSHQRLHPQWTLPDADWMTPEQVEIFSTIVKIMTKHIKDTERELQWQPPLRPHWRPYGVESRAHTRLSSGLTPSEAQNGKSTVSNTTLTTVPPRLRRGIRESTVSTSYSQTQETGRDRNASRPPHDALSPAETKPEWERSATQPLIDVGESWQEGSVSSGTSSRRRMPDRGLSRTPLIPDEARSGAGLGSPSLRRNTRERSVSRPVCARKRRRESSHNSNRGSGTLSAAPRTIAGSGRTRTIVLRSDELPFQHDVKENEPALFLEIDAVSLLVEFPAQSTGRLYISQKDPRVTSKTDIDVFELPTEGGLTLKNGPRSSLVVFQLRHSTLTRLNVGFHWGSVA